MLMWLHSVFKFERKKTSCTSSKHKLRFHRQTILDSFNTKGTMERADFKFEEVTWQNQVGNTNILLREVDA